MADDKNFKWLYKKKCISKSFNKTRSSHVRTNLGALGRGLCISVHKRIKNQYKKYIKIYISAPNQTDNLEELVDPKVTKFSSIPLFKINDESDIKKTRSVNFKRRRRRYRGTILRKTKETKIIKEHVVQTCGSSLKTRKLKKSSYIINPASSYRDLFISPSSTTGISRNFDENLMMQPDELTTSDFFNYSEISTVNKDEHQKNNEKEIVSIHKIYVPKKSKAVRGEPFKTVSLHKVKTQLDVSSPSENDATSEITCKMQLRKKFVQRLITEKEKLINMMMGQGLLGNASWKFGHESNHSMINDLYDMSTKVVARAATFPCINLGLFNLSYKPIREMIHEIYENKSFSYDESDLEFRVVNKDSEGSVYASACNSWLSLNDVVYQQAKWSRIQKPKNVTRLLKISLSTIRNPWQRAFTRKRIEPRFPSTATCVKSDSVSTEEAEFFEKQIDYCASSLQNSNSSSRENSKSGLRNPLQSSIEPYTFSDTLLILRSYGLLLKNQVKQFIRHKYNNTLLIVANSEEFDTNHLCNKNVIVSDELSMLASASSPPMTQLMRLPEEMIDKSKRKQKLKIDKRNETVTVLQSLSSHFPNRINARTPKEDTPKIRGDYDKNDNYANALSMRTVCCTAADADRAIDKTTYRKFDHKFTNTPAERPCCCALGDNTTTKSKVAESKYTERSRGDNGTSGNLGYVMSMQYFTDNFEERVVDRNDWYHNRKLESKYTDTTIDRPCCCSPVENVTLKPRMVDSGVTVTQRNRAHPEIIRCIDVATMAPAFKQANTKTKTYKLPTNMKRCPEKGLMFPSTGDMSSPQPTDANCQVDSSAFQSRTYGTMPRRSVLEMNVPVKKQKRKTFDSKSVGSSSQETLVDKSSARKTCGCSQATSKPKGRGYFSNNGNSDTNQKLDSSCEAIISPSKNKRLMSLFRRSNREPTGPTRQCVLTGEIKSKYTPETYFPKPVPTPASKHSVRSKSKKRKASQEGSIVNILKQQLHRDTYGPVCLKSPQQSAVLRAQDSSYHWERIKNVPDPLKTQIPSFDSNCPQCVKEHQRSNKYADRDLYRDHDRKSPSKAVNHGGNPKECRRMIQRKHMTRG